MAVNLENSDRYKMVVNIVADMVVEYMRGCSCRCDEIRAGGAEGSDGRDDIGVAASPDTRAA